jgi:hypothetical protein
MIMPPDLDLGRERPPEHAAAPFSISTASLSRRSGADNADGLGVRNSAASRQAWPAARRGAASKPDRRTPKWSMLVGLPARLSGSAVGPTLRLERRPAAVRAGEVTTSGADAPPRHFVGLRLA